MTHPTLRAVRGAVQIDADRRDLILDGTEELLVEILARNAVEPAHLVSLLFTMTHDLTSEFPAVAARRLGLGSVPLMCAAEIAVPGALPRVVRVMAHIESALPVAAIRHVYLRGARVLRPDLVSAGDTAPRSTPAPQS
jgi:chorismate mutase